MSRRYYHSTPNVLMLKASGRTLWRQIGFSLTTLCWYINLYGNVSYFLLLKHDILHISASQASPNQFKNLISLESLCRFSTSMGVINCRRQNASGCNGMNLWPIRATKLWNYFDNQIIVLKNILRKKESKFYDSSSLNEKIFHVSSLLYDSKPTECLSEEKIN